MCKGAKRCRSLTREEAYNTVQSIDGRRHDALRIFGVAKNQVVSRTTSDRAAECQRREDQTAPPTLGRSIQRESNADRQSESH